MSPWAVGAATCLAVFGVVAVGVVAEWPLPWAPDRAWEPVVHAWVLPRPVVVGAARAVTTLGSPVGMDVLAALVAVVAWSLGRRGAAVAVVVVRVVELIVETAVKALVDRPRPAFDPPLATASSSSFPSGHSAGSAAVVGFLVILLLVAAHGTGTTRRTLAAACALVLTLFTLAVALSRVVLGVHYPGDVVAGLLLGLACALAGQATLAALGRGSGR